MGTLIKTYGISLSSFTLVYSVLPFNTRWSREWESVGKEKSNVSSETDTQTLSCISMFKMNTYISNCLWCVFRIFFSPCNTVWSCENSSPYFKMTLCPYTQIHTNQYFHKGLFNSSCINIQCNKGYQNFQCTQNISMKLFLLSMQNYRVLWQFLATENLHVRMHVCIEEYSWMYIELRMEKSIWHLFPQKTIFW